MPAFLGSRMENETKRKDRRVGEGGYIRGYQFIRCSATSTTVVIVVIDTTVAVAVAVVSYSSVGLLYSILVHVYCAIVLLCMQTGWTGWTNRAEPCYKYEYGS